MITTICLTFLIVVIGFWLRWRRNHLEFFGKLGIPGPEPGIFFGNLWEMYVKDPVTVKKEWIKKYGSVVGYYYGLEPVLLVTDMELMKQVLVKDFGSFMDRPFRMFSLNDEDKDESPNLLRHKGQHWKEIRNLLTPSFTTGKLKKMVPIMNSALEVLLNKLEERAKLGEDFDIYNLYKGLTMDVIGRTAFGIESNVQDNQDHPLIGAAKAIFAGRFKSLFFIFAFSFRELKSITLQVSKLRLKGRNKGVNPVKELLEMCNNVVKHRREDPSRRRPDLLQTLIDARSTNDVKNIETNRLIATAEGEDTINPEGETNSEEDIKEAGSGKPERKLTDKEIAGNAFMFFLAGYETTSTALAFITHVLVNKPDEQQKLRNEIKQKIGTDDVDYDSVQRLPYMDRFINECLRLYPPIYAFVNRFSNRDVKLGKWKIPKETTIQIPVCYLHRNPDLWPEPDKFDPDRFLPENRSLDHSMIWQPFGAGPRNCVGMRFALLEIKLALGRILSKYRFEPSALTEKEKEIQVRVAAATLHPENGIHVLVKPVDN